MRVFLALSYCGEWCESGPGANLSGANLSQANLTNANFSYATLTGANLTGAEVRGANFCRDDYSGGTGISVAQLYSTASYLAHDLTGIGLGGNNLTASNFAGQNLTNADFLCAIADQCEFQPGQPHECANSSMPR